ncbi:YdcF family protein [Polynucleobacter duraquae]|nr:YdcF family protein [Polynucleobacter duraquae]
MISKDEVAGIIILGGAIAGGDVAVDRGEISIYSSAERITKAFELIRQYPRHPFIFSGFSSHLVPTGMSEANAFKQLIAEQGLSDQYAHYESQSRNTYENVLYMKPMILELVAINQSNISGAQKPWLLITSASHMYRSLKIFQKQGLAVIPVPVDYQTGRKLNWGSFSLIAGAQQWNNVIHEVVGLLAYWITGKI